MAREAQIVATLVELASTPEEEFDVVYFLHRMAGRCVELLDCTEVGMLLTDRDGVLRVMASSSERSEALDLLQTQNDEGPCLESFKTGQPVVSENLEKDVARWPSFTPAALGSGFRSVQALPMRVGGKPVGSLNLFRAKIGEVSERDIPLGQGMADVAALSLLQSRSLSDAQGLADQLQGALSSRVAIEQAKGMLAERADISIDAAFEWLRINARAHNRRLTDVAKDLVEGDLKPTALADPSGG